MYARTMLSLLLAVLVAAPLFAGDKAKEKAKKGQKKPAKAFSLADGTLKRLAKAELSEEQISKIQALSEEYTPRVAEARKKLASIITPEQRKQRAEALKAAKKAGKKPSEVVKSFKLTPEQEEALEAARKEMSEVTGAYNKAVLALLSDEQRQKLRGPKQAGAKKPALKKAEKKPAEKKGEKKPAE